MAYFNYVLAEKKGLSPRDVHIINMVNQNKVEDVSEQLQLEMEKDNISRLKAFDLITMIKGTKKQNEFQRLRLTKKGKSLHNALQIANTVPNDFEMATYIITAYKKLDKKVSSENKIIELIAWFRVETGFTHKEIFTVLNAFINDDNQMDYSNILDNIFWKRPHMYAIHKKIEDSRLHAYYNHNKVMFDRKFEKLKND